MHKISKFHRKCRRSVSCVIEGFMVFRDSAHLHRNSTTNSVYVAKVSKVFQATSKDIKIFLKHFLIMYNFGMFLIKQYQCNCINENPI